MGDQRERDLEFFHPLGELRELTGYTPRRLNEITKRYINRPRPDGKKRRVFYQKAKEICNDEFSEWLLIGRFYGEFVTARPEGTVTLKQAQCPGLSYDALRHRIRRGELGAYIHRGRYLVERVVTQALGERYDRAPDNWVPIVTLKELSGRARQSVYAWVGRKSKTRTFAHPNRAQPARHLPLHDAFDYLSHVLGSARYALKLLAQSAPKYFRSLGKTVVKNLFPRANLQRAEHLTLDVTFIPGVSLPLPLNPSQLGHGLLQLRT